MRNITRVWLRSRQGAIRATLFRLGLVSLLVSACSTFPGNAAILDVSSLQGYIYQVDTSTNVMTTVLNTHGAAVDSLVFALGITSFLVFLTRVLSGFSTQSHRT